MTQEPFSISQLDHAIARRYGDLSNRLSQSQLATLELWARGLNNSEIARVRGVEKVTIKNIKNAIRREMTVETGSDAQAIILAAYWIWKYGRA